MKTEITFTAIFARATTLVDGGWRISFDVSESDAKDLHLLSQMRNKLLQVAVVGVKPSPIVNDYDVII